MMSYLLELYLILVLVAGEVKRDLALLWYITVRAWPTAAPCLCPCIPKHMTASVHVNAITDGELLPLHSTPR